MSTTGMRPPDPWTAAADAALCAATDALGGEGFGLLLLDHQCAMELAAAVRMTRCAGTAPAGTDHVADHRAPSADQAAS